MSEVPYHRLRNSLTARILISGLERDGFLLDHSSGSHRIYLHPNGRRVTLSFHGMGETFTTKTLKSIVERQANWSLEDLIRLKIIKD